MSVQSGSQRLANLLDVLRQRELGRLRTRLPVPLARHLGRAPRRFAVLTAGRSGSQLLLSLLDSHPSIRSLGEVIGEAEIGKPRVRRRIESDGAVDYVRRRFRRHGFESVVGAKFLYYQLEKPYESEHGLPDSTAVLRYLIDDEDIRIIHLKRRDRLRMLVSTEVAARTRQYRLAPGQKRAPAPTIELSPQRCTEFFATVDAWERTYDALFREHAMLEVLYEELVADTTERCNLILDFLGMPRRRLTARTRRQGHRGIPDIVENYADLQRHFASSQWAGFFLDAPPRR